MKVVLAAIGNTDYFTLLCSCSRCLTSAAELIVHCLQLDWRELCSLVLCCVIIARPHHIWLRNYVPFKRFVNIACLSQPRYNMDSLSVHYTVNKTVYEKKGKVEQVTNALPNV